MSLINVKKEKLVVEDIALGTGEVIQDRGTGIRVSAQSLPYDDNETIADAIDKKENTTEVDSKLALKADLQGDDNVRFKAASGSLPNEVINKEQLDNAIEDFDTIDDVDAKLALKADLNGNGLYTFNVAEAVNSTEAINKNQLNNTIAPLETTASVDAKLVDVYSALDNKADLNGNVNETFLVDTPVNSNDAVNKSHLDDELANKADLTYVNTELSTKVSETNVLLKDGSSPSFTPVSDNQPTTKKYVDELVVNIGAGDMAKAIYDTDNSGTVDSAEAIGVIGSILGKTPMNQIMRLAQSNISDANTVDDFGLFVGTDIANTPISGQLIVAQMILGNKKHQAAYNLNAPDIYIRAFDGITWTAWQKNAREEDVVNITGDTMSGNLSFLNNLGIEGYDSGNNLKSLLKVLGDTLTIGEVGLDVAAEGNWNFPVVPTSDESPASDNDLTRKDYVDTEILNNKVEPSVAQVASSTNTNPDSIEITGGFITATNSYFNSTNGLSDKGYNISGRIVNKSVPHFDSAVDGIKWVSFNDGDTESVFDTKPSYGLYTKEYAEDNRLVFVDGAWRETVGGELVINGDFSDGTLIWTTQSGHALSIVNQQLKVESVSGSDYCASYDIPTTIGEKYTIKFTNNPTDRIGYVRVLKLDGSTITDIINSGDTFIAEETTSRIALYGNFTASGQTTYFDNISIYKLEPTIGNPITPIPSFMQNPVMFTNGVPQYIDYSQDLEVNYMDSLYAKKLTSPSIEIGETKWLNDGVDYDDPDAIGANPVAKIYPDGTIVGSTDNGEYVKYPNGELEIGIKESTLVNIEVSNRTGTTAGSVWYNTVTVSFPFIAISIKTSSATITEGKLMSWCTLGSITNSDALLTLVNYRNGDTIQASVIIKGRWK